MTSEERSPYSLYGQMTIAIVEQGRCMKQIVVHQEKCTACRECELA